VKGVVWPAQPEMVAKPTATADAWSEFRRPAGGVSMRYRAAV
jgi:hypothetical protein